MADDDLQCLPFGGSTRTKVRILPVLKIGEMEQAYSEMFLAEPEPKFRLSRQHLCCLVKGMMSLNPDNSGELMGNGAV